MLRRTIGALAGLTLLVGAGCGDDDEGADDEYCDLVEELTASDEQPSDDLLDRYVDAAPDEIADEAEIATEAIKEDGEAAFDDPDVLAAIEDIEAFEAEECGAGADVEGDEDDGADDDGTTDDTDVDDVDDPTVDDDGAGDADDDMGDDTSTTTTAVTDDTSTTPTS